MLLLYVLRYVVVLLLTRLVRCIRTAADVLSKPTFMYFEIRGIAFWAVTGLAFCQQLPSRSLKYAKLPFEKLHVWHVVKTRPSTILKYVKLPFAKLCVCNSVNTYLQTFWNSRNYLLVRKKREVISRISKYFEGTDYRLRNYILGTSSTTTFEYVEMREITFLRDYIGVILSNLTFKLFGIREITFWEITCLALCQKLPSNILKYANLPFEKLPCLTCC
jgi:hypothetical protein